MAIACSWCQVAGRLELVTLVCVWQAKGTCSHTFGALDTVQAGGVGSWNSI